MCTQTLLISAPPTMHDSVHEKTVPELGWCVKSAKVTVDSLINS